MSQTGSYATFPASLPTSPERVSKAVGFWLLVCAGMILVMVVLGGVTRLTHSGLSIVEWKPLTGVLPPLNESAWQELFAKYRQYPEYQKLNSGMTLQGFKSIFWLEFLHRLWGRTIGLAFLVPFLYFALRKGIPRALVPRLLGIFTLGALQGVMGWYMVKSGLVDRPDVSQYRLTAHLGLAFVIYGYLVWTALDILHPFTDATVSRPFRHMALMNLALIVVTVLAGGFVAGLDAGFAYNTFPLMAGHLIPEQLWTLSPWPLNLFENPTTVQFMHRLLAMLTGTCVLLFCWWSGKLPLQPRARLACRWLGIAVVLQFSLGVATLLLVVPVAVAAAHQAGSLLLFTAMLWVLHELRPSLKLGHVNPAAGAHQPTYT